jgi:hypothetical protein
MKGLDVVIVRPVAYTLLGNERLQERRNCLLVNVVHRFEATSFDNPPDSAHEQLDVAGTVVRECLFKRLEDFYERSVSPLGGSLESSIDKPATAQLRFILDHGRQLFRPAAIREALASSPIPVLVTVTEVPRLPLLTAVLFSFVNGGHCANSGAWPERLPDVPDIRVRSIP